MNHLEIEYKTMLDKEEYQSLLPLLLIQNWLSKPITISIHPTSSSVRKKWPCRVRTFTDQAELTLKVPEDVGHFEYNQDLSPRRNRGDPSTPTVSLTEKSKPLDL